MVASSCRPISFCWLMILMFSILIIIHTYLSIYLCLPLRLTVSAFRHSWRWFDCTWVQREFEAIHNGVGANDLIFCYSLSHSVSLSLSAQSSLCSIFPSNSFNEREMIIHSYSISISTDTNTHILQLWPLYCLIAHVSCILDNEYDEWIWPAWWKASKRFIVSIKSNVLRNAKQNGRAGHHKADLRFSMKQSSCGHNRRAICYIYFIIYEQIAFIVH